MAGDFHKVSSGDRLRIPAATYNAVMDAVKAATAAKQGPVGGGPLGNLITPANSVLIKWTGSSVSTLDPFSILAYGTAVTDPSADPDTSAYSAMRRPCFEGSAVADASLPFVVTTEPITGQRVGRAVAAGLAVCQVDVSDEAHTRAVPDVGNTDNLVSAASGGVPVLWKESGTGVVWAVILLGDMAGGACEFCTDYQTTNTNFPIGTDNYVTLGTAGTGTTEYLASNTYFESPAHDIDAEVYGEIYVRANVTASRSATPGLASYGVIVHAQPVVVDSSGAFVSALAPYQRCVSGTAWEFTFNGNWISVGDALVGLGLQSPTISGSDYAGKASFRGRIPVMNTLRLKWRVKVALTSNLFSTITVTTKYGDSDGRTSIIYREVCSDCDPALPPAPVADFTGAPTSGSNPLSVTFTDSSTNYPTSWLWEKNSGSGWVNFTGTPTAQNPTESLATGTWSIRLTATNVGGSNTKTRTNYIVVS